MINCGSLPLSLNSAPTHSLFLSSFDISISHLSSDPALSMFSQMAAAVHRHAADVANGGGVAVPNPLSTAGMATMLVTVCIRGTRGTADCMASQHPGGLGDSHLSLIDMRFQVVRDSTVATIKAEYYRRLPAPLQQRVHCPASFLLAFRKAPSMNSADGGRNELQLQYRETETLQQLLLAGNGDVKGSGGLGSMMFQQAEFYVVPIVLQIRDEDGIVEDADTPATDAMLATADSAMRRFDDHSVNAAALAPTASLLADSGGPRGSAGSRKRSERLREKELSQKLVTLSFCAVTMRLIQVRVVYMAEYELTHQTKLDSHDIGLALGRSDFGGGTNDHTLTAVLHDEALLADVLGDLLPRFDPAAKAVIVHLKAVDLCEAEAAARRGGLVTSAALLPPPNENDKVMKKYVLSLSRVHHARALYLEKLDEVMPLQRVASRVAFFFMDDRLPPVEATVEFNNFNDAIKDVEKLEKNDADILAGGRNVIASQVRASQQWSAFVASASYYLMLLLLVMIQRSLRAPAGMAEFVSQHEAALERIMARPLPPAAAASGASAADGHVYCLGAAWHSASLPIATKSVVAFGATPGASRDESARNSTAATEEATMNVAGLFHVENSVMIRSLADGSSKRRLPLISADSQPSPTDAAGGQVDRWKLSPTLRSALEGRSDVAAHRAAGSRASIPMVAFLTLWFQSYVKPPNGGIALVFTQSTLDCISHKATFKSTSILVLEADDTDTSALLFGRGPPTTTYHAPWATSLWQTLLGAGSFVGVLGFFTTLFLLFMWTLSEGRRVFSEARCVLMWTPPMTASTSEELLPLTPSSAVPSLETGADGVPPPAPPAITFGIAPPVTSPPPAAQAPPPTPAAASGAHPPAARIRLKLPTRAPPLLPPTSTATEATSLVEGGSPHLPPPNATGIHSPRSANAPPVDVVSPPAAAANAGKQVAAATAPTVGHISYGTIERPHATPTPSVAAAAAARPKSPNAVVKLLAAAFGKNPAAGKGGALSGDDINEHGLPKVVIFEPYRHFLGLGQWTFWTLTLFEIALGITACCYFGNVVSRLFTFVVSASHFYPHGEAAFPRWVLPLSSWAAQGSPTAAFHQPSSWKDAAEYDGVRGLVDQAILFASLPAFLFVRDFTDRKLLQNIATLVAVCLVLSAAFIDVNFNAKFGAGTLGGGVFGAGSVDKSLLGPLLSSVVSMILADRPIVKMRRRELFFRNEAVEPASAIPEATEELVASVFTIIAHTFVAIAAFGFAFSLVG